MLTREEVLELADQHGLGDHAVRLVERVRPGYRLEPDPRRPASPGGSRIGGHPDLAPGEAWPVNARGVAMTFVAQVACSTLLPIEGWEDPRPWTHQGRLLRIFADLLDNPNEPGLAVALACDPSAGLTRTEAPPIPDPFPKGGEWDDLEPEDRFHVLPEATVRFTPFLTAPELDPVLRPELHDFSDPAERYGDWANDVRAGGAGWRGEPDTDADPPDGLTDDEFDRWLAHRPRAPWELHHLLGEPSSIQDDVLTTGAAIYSGDWEMLVTPDPELAAGDAWRVLLALHMDERFGLRIHDAGAFTVLAPVADLAGGRYDRLVCSVDSG